MSNFPPLKSVPALSPFAPASLRSVVEPMLTRLGIARGYEDVNGLGKLVAALSASYNTEAVAAGKVHYAARLGFSLLRDIPKSTHAISDLAAAGLLPLPSGRPFRILDIGAGCGATTIGVLHTLWKLASKEGAPPLKVEVTLVDPEEGATALAQRAIEGISSSISVKVTSNRHGVSTDGAIDVDLLPWFGDQPYRVSPTGERKRLAAKEGQGYDLVLLGQVLSELDRQLSPEQRISRHAALLTGILESRVAPKGTLVVVEPALKERTRHLHAVRDRLLGNAGVTLFGPCLHNAPCPALAKENDWCHEDKPDVLPEFLIPVARAAGLRWEGVTYSPLLLRKDGVTLRSTLPKDRRALRVVGDLVPTKGKVEVQLCGDGLAGEPATRLRMMRIDRDSSETNEFLEEVSRGDLLAIDGPMVRADRIGPETEVTPLSPKVPS